MNKRLRICLFCHRGGITIYFPTGNALRQHVKVRHPQTPAQMTVKKNQLREYRKNLLLAQERFRKVTTEPLLRNLRSILPLSTCPGRAVYMSLAALSMESCFATK